MNSRFLIMRRVARWAILGGLGKCEQMFPLIFPPRIEPRQQPGGAPLRDRVIVFRAKRGYYRTVGGL
ncbi:MAG: hypothetical protein ACREUF_02920, partial [Solimonas sp.]